MGRRQAHSGPEIEKLCNVSDDDVIIQKSSSFDSLGCCIKRKYYIRNRAQSFTLFKADLYQDINGGLPFTRAPIGS